MYTINYIINYDNKQSSINILNNNNNVSINNSTISGINVCIKQVKLLTALYYYYISTLVLTKTCQN